MHLNLRTDQSNLSTRDLLDEIAPLDPINKNDSSMSLWTNNERFPFGANKE